MQRITQILPSTTVIVALLLLFVFQVQGQTTLYSETFGTNGLTTDPPNWTTTYGGSGTFEVISNEMTAEDVTSEAVWSSNTITITGYSTNISADFNLPGASYNASDYIKAYYKLDGGAEVLWFDGTDDTWTAGNKSSSASAGCLTGTTLQIVIRVLNNWSWVDSYSFDNVLIEGYTAPAPGATTNYTFTSPTLTLSAALGNCLSDYTFTQTLPSDQANINSGETVTVNFIAGTDATTMTGGTFNGSAINMGTVTTTATSITFTTPTGGGDCSSELSFTLNDITNPTWGSSGNATVGVDNITTGRDTGTYAYEIAVNNNDFVDYDGTTASNFATQDGLGNCHNSLPAGINCFRYTNQVGGTIKITLTTDCAGSGGNTSSQTISGGGSTVSQGGSIASLGTWDGCSQISTGLPVGTAAPATVLTHCVTVTPACAAAGASFCPLFDCSAGDCGSGSLPIDLLFFKAIKQDNAVKLSWTTTAEINNDYFTVERTEDGFLYTEVTTVAGAGNSNSVLNYTTFDEDPLPGLSYYRLRQTDYDGNYSHSQLVAVEFNDEETSLKINYTFSNYTEGKLQYQFSYNQNNPVTIDVLDVAGRVVYSEIISGEQSENVLSINLNHLAKGPYLLKISDGTHASFEKFVY